MAVKKSVERVKSTVFGGWIYQNNQRGLSYDQSESVHCDINISLILLLLYSFVLKWLIPSSDSFPSGFIVIHSITLNKLVSKFLFFSFTAKIIFNWFILKNQWLSEFL